MLQALRHLKAIRTISTIENMTVEQMIAEMDRRERLKLASQQEMDALLTPGENAPEAPQQFDDFTRWRIFWSMTVGIGFLMYFGVHV